MHAIAYHNARLQCALEAVREHNAIEIVTHILAENSRLLSEARKFDDRISSIHAD